MRRAPPVRILTHVIALERVGGMEVNTLEVSRALAQRGHDVHVVHGPSIGEFPMPDMRAEFESAGITLHGPQRFPAPSLATAVPSVALSVPSARLAARLRPDVVWLQRFEHIIWGRVTALAGRAPLVCHLHHALGSRLIPLAARGVPQFIAVSEFMRRLWVPLGLAPERVAVVHNAAPAENYPYAGEVERKQARQALGLPADVPIALYYGRLEEPKGLLVALDAWQQAQPRLASGHLVLAGGYPPSADASLRARVDELVRAGSVTLLPMQGDVVPLLHAADLVLFPSRLPEAFGRVALEGLMTGRPVLASAVGGVPEIVSGPLAPLLVPEGDAAALAEGIASLLLWRERDPELGARCAAEMTARFSFTEHVDRIEQLLDGVRHPRRRRPAGPPR